MYQTFDESIPAIPIGSFFRTEEVNIRRVEHADTSRCYIVPTANTDQFKNTNFVDWSQLDGSEVPAETIINLSVVQRCWFHFGSILCFLQAIVFFTFFYLLSNCHTKCFGV